MDFGETLRSQRLAAGLTQEQLAATVGIDHTYISKLEANRVRPPSVPTLLRMAAALNQPPEVVCGAAGRVHEPMTRVQLEAEVLRLRATLARCRQQQEPQP